MEHFTRKEVSTTKNLAHKFRQAIQYFQGRSSLIEGWPSGQGSHYLVGSGDSKCTEPDPHEQRNYPRFVLMTSWSQLTKRIILGYSLFMLPSQWFLKLTTLLLHVFYFFTSLFTTSLGFIVFSFEVISFLSLWLKRGLCEDKAKTNHFRWDYHYMLLKNIGISP